MTEPASALPDSDPAQPFDPLAVECFKRARDAWGTAEIATKRASLIKARPQQLSFVGLLVPLVIGGLTIAYKFSSHVESTLIIVASALLIVQTAASLWAITAKWDDRYSEATRSVTENRRLFRAFDTLLRNAPSDRDMFQRQLDLLIADDNATQQYDYGRGEWSDAERRFGMRAGLVRMEGKCPGCGTVPTAMTASTKCGVCGGFTTSRARAPRLRKPVS